MSERRELRRTAGLLLLWCMAPLPFTGIVLPAFWLTTVAASLHLLLRPAGVIPLSLRAENFVGLLILVAVIASGGLHLYGPMRPLGNLLLPLTAIRTLQVGDRPSFLRAGRLALLVWTVSVASSTHVALIPYLAVSVAVLWWGGMRVLLTGLRGAHGETPAHGATPSPRPLHAACAAVVVMALAIPVFLIMPRLRSPLVAGVGGVRAVSGFSLGVDLSSVGAIQQSREIALVLRATHGERISEAWTRLRATALELKRPGVWDTGGSRRVRLSDTDGGLLWLGDDRELPPASVELEVDLLRPEAFLFVPQGAVALQAEGRHAFNASGGVMVGRPDRHPQRYQVWVSPRPVSYGSRPAPEDLFVPSPDPRVEALARQLGRGLRRAEDKAAAVTRYLERTCTYSLEGPGQIAGDPVAWFLLDGRRGHCEFFAGAMVVLLRSMGVPARMVTGFYGGSQSPAGDEVVVRQANAHAWVEAWLGQERGWTVFDPTPAEGVPDLAAVDQGERLRWAWEQIQIIWDRWILTYGTAEQLEVLSRVGGLAGHLPRLVGDKRLLLGGGLAALLAAGLLASRGVHRRRRHRRGPAAAAMARVERRLLARGADLHAGATLRAVGSTAESRWPAAAPALFQLVQLAETELYAPTGSPATDPEVVRRLWGEVRTAAGGER